MEANDTNHGDNDDWDVFMPPGGSIVKRNFTPSCFDVFAGLWVFLYERSFPGAGHDAQQSYLLNELRQSVDRLKIRRDELSKKLKVCVMDAKKVHVKGDVKNFKNKMIGVRR